MSSTSEIAGLDPRIKRSRQLLQEALEKLLSEKDFEKISVQDIAETATLNRATFYDHYSDKFALLECLVAARFRDLLQRRHIQFDGCEGAIKAMATGVCAYLSEMPFSSQRHSGQPLETAIVAVVRGMILEGLKAHRPPKKAPLELMASTAAWAIYGAAKEWARTPNRVSVDRIASTIEAMISPIFDAARPSHNVNLGAPR